MKKITLILILLTTALFLSIAQEEAIFTFEVDGKIYNMQERMSQENAQGVSLYAMKNDGADTMLQWGYRDVENQLKVEENTLFHVGGMTGALTNFAVLRLANDGKIDLDTDVNEYMTSWQLPESKFTKTQPVTVRDLLLQKRGFKTISKPGGYVPGSKLPNLVQMLNGEAPSQEQPVKLVSNRNKSGNSSFYNTMILHQMLEDVHGKPFVDIMNEEVLQALNMTESTFSLPLTEEEASRAALGYDDQGNMIEGGRWLYPELAAAGLWCTPKDYARFVNHIIQAAKGQDNRYLSQELAQASINPEEGYRALILLKNDDYLYWGGASQGFYTQFEANVEEGWIIVVFINTHLRWKLNGEIRHRAKQLVAGKM